MQSKVISKHTLSTIIWGQRWQSTITWVTPIEMVTTRFSFSRKLRSASSPSETDLRSAASPSALRLRSASQEMSAIRATTRLTSSPDSARSHLSDYMIIMRDFTTLRLADSCCVALRGIGSQNRRTKEMPIPSCRDRVVRRVGTGMHM
jgi:hypothetical protein